MIEHLIALNDEWAGCEKCKIHCSKARPRMVRVDNYTYRLGILFISEYPFGESNAEGYSTMGYEGQMMTSVCSDIDTRKLPYGFADVIACTPLNETGRVRVPTEHEVSSCEDRLKRLVEITNPVMIINLGYQVQDYTRPFYVKHFDRKMMLRTISSPSTLLKRGGLKSPYYPKWRDELQKLFNVAKVNYGEPRYEHGLAKTKSA